MNRKEYSEKIQKRAMEIVELSPLSDEVDALIREAIAQHGFQNRMQAFRFLQDTGKLEGKETGGRLLNGDTAVSALVSEFGCHLNTAKSHVAKAARRKRHPDWTPPEWGGSRPGAGRPPAHQE